MRCQILVISLAFLTVIPVFADFHTDMIQFLPDNNSFDENWQLTDIQGFKELEIDFSEFSPDGLIQRFVFTGQNEEKMITTISIYDFADSKTASNIFDSYVTQLSQKGYQNGQLADNLQNDCYSAMINHGMNDEKTSIVCKNSKYIVISTSEQTDFVYYKNKQFTTTIAANGFSNTIFQNIQESKSKIPEWVKNNAGWWADGITTDSTFIEAIQYLIDQKIIIIPEVSEKQESINSSIPEWIKNNAKWWADGQIDDKTFVQAIQFLFQEGILKQ